MVDKTLQRKLQIEQHEPHKNPGVVLQSMACTQNVFVCSNFVHSLPFTICVHIQNNDLYFQHHMLWVFFVCSMVRCDWFFFFEIVDKYCLNLFFIVCFLQEMFPSGQDTLPFNSFTDQYIFMCGLQMSCFLIFSAILYYMEDIFSNTSFKIMSFRGLTQH